MGDEYSERYIAFIDILGFTRLLDGLENGGISIDKIRTALLRIQKPARGLESYYIDADLRWQTMSDAIVLSSALTPGGLLHLIFSIDILVTDLLADEFFTRGSLVRGRLVHEQNMIFGAGPGAAYQLEQTVVRYPRIMITNHVVRDLMPIAEDPRWKNFFSRSRWKQSEDGPFFVHTLGLVASWGICKTDERAIRGRSSPFDHVKESLEKRLFDASNNPQHYEKVLWFVKYWNDTMRDYVAPLCPIAYTASNKVEQPRKRRRFWLFR